MKIRVVMEILLNNDRVEVDGTEIVRVGQQFRVESSIGEVLEKAFGNFISTERLRREWTRTVHAMLVLLLSERDDKGPGPAGRLEVPIAAVAAAVGGNATTTRKTLLQWFELERGDRTPAFMIGLDTISWQPRESGPTVILHPSARDWLRSLLNSAPLARIAEWSEPAQLELKEILQQVGPGRMLLVQILGTRGLCLVKMLRFVISLSEAKGSALVRVLVDELDDEVQGLLPRGGLPGVWLEVRQYPQGCDPWLHGHVVGTARFESTPNGPPLLRDPKWLKAYYGPRLPKEHPDGPYLAGYDVADAKEPTQARWISTFVARFEDSWGSAPPVLNIIRSA